MDRKNIVQANRHLTTSLVAMAASLVLAAPARADRVLCDGNIFCLAVAVPFLLGHVAVAELANAAGQRAAKPSRLPAPTDSNMLLMDAVAAGDLSATTALVSAGIAPGAWRSRVLSVATTPEIHAFLLANGAIPAEVDLNDVALQITRPGAADLLTSLLDARPALDANDAGAHSLLRSAIILGRGEIVTTLLERGINPNPAVSAGARAPLVIALVSCSGVAASCENSMLPIVRALIAKGANVKVVDAETGKTVLAIAQEKNYAAVVKLLEDAGA